MRLAGLSVVLAVSFAGATAEGKDGELVLYDGRASKNARYVNFDSFEKIGDATVFKTLVTKDGSLDSYWTAVVFCGKSKHESLVQHVLEASRSPSSGALRPTDFSREDFRTAIAEAKFSPSSGKIENYNFEELSDQIEAVADEWVETGRGPYNLLRAKFELVVESRPAYVFPHSELLYEIACIDKVRKSLERKGESTGSSAKRATQKRDECPGRAQAYQDAYEQRGRVDDLICLKRALEREFR